MKEKVYKKLAQLIQARLNCIEKENDEWEEKHENEIDRIIKDHLPHGSGIDSDVIIDLDQSNGEKIVIHFSYHKMNEIGMYDGWVDCTITITASLVFEINMDIDLDCDYYEDWGEEDELMLGDYLHDLFYDELIAEII